MIKALYIPSNKSSITCEKGTLPITCLAFYKSTGTACYTGQLPCAVTFPTSVELGYYSRCDRIPIRERHLIKLVTVRTSRIMKYMKDITLNRNHLDERSNPSHGKQSIGSSDLAYNAQALAQHCKQDRLSLLCLHNLSVKNDCMETFNQG